MTRTKAASASISIVIIQIRLSRFFETTRMNVQLFGGEMHSTITVNTHSSIGPVRRETFGAFIEHLGRCVYGGIYEPGHPSSDENGFRGDVTELVRELGVSTVRYPGGNFVSGYRWEDGIGPKDQRPKRLDLAWHSLEPNEVGIDEFMAWTRKAEVQPIMAINLGTRGIESALDILEYCNVTGRSYWAEQRQRNSAEDPYRIKTWCLGNEMDGTWQLGHKSSEEYGRLAAVVARAMRMLDPNLNLIACGSSGRSMPTYGEWERTVLAHTFDQVDMISAHSYYQQNGSGLQEFLLSAEDMERFIQEVGVTIDTVAAAKKSDKKIGISFDEWNVWYVDSGLSKPPTGDDWPVAPRLLEDNYSVADAVVVGSLLISLLRNTDRVYSANLAQLVNVIAPIMTEPGGKAWKQTIFHPFALTSRHAKGHVVAVEIDGPTITSTEYGEVQALHAVATWHDGEGAIFIVNRHVFDHCEIRIEVSAHVQLVEAVVYHHEDHTWKASALDDTSIVPQPNDSATLTDGKLHVVLPALSWSMLRLTTR